MIKKRARPTARQRDHDSPTSDSEPGVSAKVDSDAPSIDVTDLVELRKYRRARQGIDAGKLNHGDAKRRRDAVTKHEEPEDRDIPARRMVRASNFTQQTNALDVDKHMMAYIEDNMRIRRGEEDEPREEAYDPHAELFRLEMDVRAQPRKPVKDEEGSVANSASMLSAIHEVDLGMDARLKNIEDTEKAKRYVAEVSEETTPEGPPSDDLVSARFFQPGKHKMSEAAMIKNAKLEAMGFQADTHKRPRSDRRELATDDLVMERFKKRMRKQR